jgi:hypothetical protein
MCHCASLTLPLYVPTLCLSLTAYLVGITPGFGDFESNFENCMKQLCDVVLPRAEAGSIPLPQQQSWFGSIHGTTTPPTEPLRDTSLDVVFICADDAGKELAKLISEHLVSSGTCVSPCEIECGTFAWYVQCNTADVVVPVLNSQFVLQVETEGQITYAKDCGKRIVPVMQSFQGFWGVMQLQAGGDAHAKHCATCCCETKGGKQTNLPPQSEAEPPVGVMDSINKPPRFCSKCGQALQHDDQRFCSCCGEQVLQARTLSAASALLQRPPG